jgi:hypothetical protein
MAGAIQRLIPELRPLQVARAVLCALALLTHLAVPLLHGQHSHCDHHHAPEHGSVPSISGYAEAEHDHSCELCEQLARTQWSGGAVALQAGNPLAASDAASDFFAASGEVRSAHIALAARGPPHNIA